MVKQRNSVIESEIMFKDNLATFSEIDKTCRRNAKDSPYSRMKHD